MGFNWGHEQQKSHLIIDKLKFSCFSFFTFKVLFTFLFDYILMDLMLVYCCILVFCAVVLSLNSIFCKFNTFFSLVIQYIELSIMHLFLYSCCIKPLLQSQFGSFEVLRSRSDFSRFIRLSQFGCQTTFKRSRVTDQSNMSHTSFFTKSCTSCPETASAAFVLRGAASFCRLFIFPPSLLSRAALLSAWIETKFLSLIFRGALKERASGLCFLRWLCFHFLFSCHTNSCRTGFVNFSSNFLAHKLLQQWRGWRSSVGSSNVTSACSREL